jgi:hypothetical protein
MLLLLASCTIYRLVLFGSHDYIPWHQVQGIAKKMLVDCADHYGLTRFSFCALLVLASLAWQQLELERYHSPHQRIWLTANLYGVQLPGRLECYLLDLAKGTLLYCLLA